MIWSWTLYRYLAKQFLIGVGIVFAGDHVPGLFHRSRRPDESDGGAACARRRVFGMSLLKLPDLGLTLLPFAVLLGGVFSFVRLSRSQELMSIRAAGVSAWNLLAPALTVAVVLGLLLRHRW